MARSLAPCDIRVNVISPGIIDTQMSRNAQSQIQKHIDKAPTKRIGYATDISNLLLFLLNAKSDYLNAQNIHINGGLTL